LQFETWARFFFGLNFSWGLRRCVFCEFDYDSTSQSVKELNEEVASQSDKVDDDSGCSHDNYSEEEMSDESDSYNDDGYNGYDGYNEYGEHDRGYYYRDGRCERKTSPMMSPIISPVTAC